MIDFHTELPAWSAYFIYTAGTSDKFYDVRIDLGDDGLFYVTTRWGRRPDKGGGQTGQVSRASLNAARAFASEKIRDKKNKGYREVARPASAAPHVLKGYEGDDEDYGTEMGSAF